MPHLSCFVWPEPLVPPWHPDLADQYLHTRKGRTLRTGQEASNKLVAFSAPVKNALGLDPKGIKNTMEIGPRF
jgi:hypothetical protein